MATQKIKIKGAKILVVDDEAELTEIVRDFLEGSGYIVQTENTSDKAIATAKSFRPDLILLDIMMPGKDGYEICKEIKKDLALQNVPVIFLTGKEALEDKQRSYQVGGDLYIKKPFSCESLLGIVKMVLIAVNK